MSTIESIPNEIANYMPEEITISIPVNVAYVVPVSDVLADIKMCVTLAVLAKLSSNCGFKPDHSRALRMLFIDPQVCFVEGGSLQVLGGKADCERACDIIDTFGSHIDHIFVTKDTHNPTHIAHPSSWINPDGNNPIPYTMISVEDVRTGKWRLTWTPEGYVPEEHDNMSYGLYYVTKLAERNKYSLCIWPVHGIKGSSDGDSSKVEPTLQAKLDTLEGVNKVYVEKGENDNVEQYSVFRAEVPDVTCPNTVFGGALNTDLLNGICVGKIGEPVDVFVSGEALTHCVKASVEDLMNYVSNNELDVRIFLVMDCTSSVPMDDYFLEPTKEFLTNFVLNGGILIRSDELINV